MFGLREREDYLLQLLFVRHGESCGNVGLATPEEFHPDDPPLTQKGMEQAQLLSAQFKKGEVTRIYSSPLTRAVQTAYPLAQKLETEIELLPDLMEIGTHITGCSPEILARDFPLAIPCTVEPSPAGGTLLLPETEDSFRLTQRAERCVDYIRKKHSSAESVVVVSHGSFLSYLVRAALNVSDSQTFNCEADNCSVTCVAIRKGDNLPLLRTANNTSYLK